MSNQEYIQGTNVNVDPSDSTCQGEYNVLSGRYCHAIGDSITISGRDCRVIGDGSTVVGAGSEVKGVKNVVVGRNNLVKGDGNLIVGNDLVHQGDSQVVLGDINLTELTERVGRLERCLARLVEKVEGNWVPIEGERVNPV